MNVQLRPLSAGRLLDRSFRLYRKHFVKLILLTLVLYGPFYLLMNLLVGESANGLRLSDWFLDQESAEESLALGGLAAMNGVGVGWRLVLLVLVLVPLFLNVCIPLFVAGTLHLVKADLLQEEQPSLGDMLKRGLRRFWPMLGNGLLAQAIGFTVYIALVLIIVIVGAVLAIGAGSMLAASFMGDNFAGTLLFGGLMGLIGVAVFGTIVYFLLRFIYFLPGVALGEVGIGFAQSWRLTRRSFWRLLSMYLVLTAIVYPLTIILVLLLSLFGGLLPAAGVVVQLLETVASIVIAPMWVLPYAVSYFDLKVRSEGLGLQELMRAAGIEAEVVTNGKPVKKQIEPFSYSTPKAAPPAEEAPLIQKGSDEDGPGAAVDLRKRDDDE